MSRNDLFKELNNLLRDVTVLDPACGSGSFLVGMLTVLDDLQVRANKQLGIEEDVYTRRKRIIGQSLYGVDVMDFAVHIAELRLWLQLMIETEIHPAQLQVDPLLPNLSFKIRQGDSLVQEIGGLDFTLHRSTVELPSDVKGKITKLKGDKMKFYNSQKLSEDVLKQKELNLFRDILFAKRHAIENRLKSIDDTLNQKQTELLGGEKRAVSEKDAKALENESQMLNAELAQVKEARDALRNAQVVPFVWDLAFVEIFEGDKKGFDIVIGNPPYVRQEKIAPPDQQENNYTATQWRKIKKEYKDKLRRSVAAAYPTFFDYKLGKKTFRKLDAKSDLYVYFYLHGLSLLNPKGSFCFITSNSWLDVGYGKDLQEFLLKHSHVKVILDNQAKRSFAQADVNTIIALLSTPDDRQQSGLDKTARFVMFKTPFEYILSPVIFMEIEEADERMSRPEFRVCVLQQGELHDEGLGTSRYEGNKWGGKYLRAPDIFFTILEKGKGKLVRLGDIAEVRRGFTTGANEFFYLDDEKIAEWGIEEEFLKPVIKSPRECKSIIINPADLKFQIFMCHKDKRELKGTNALEYIEWGEEQKSVARQKQSSGIPWPQLPSVRNRRLWYSIEVDLIQDLVWLKMIRERFLTVWNPDQFLVDQRLYAIQIANGISKLCACLSLNSTLTLLFLEIIGRGYGGGGGPIELTVEEVTKLTFVDPRIIPVQSKLILDRGILEIPKEIHQPDRRALDDVVFDVLGLTAGEREGVYEAVVELVKRRLEKAKSV